MKDWEGNKKYESNGAHTHHADSSSGFYASSIRVCSDLESFFHFDMFRYNYLCTSMLYVEIQEINKNLSRFYLYIISSWL